MSGEKVQAAIIGSGNIGCDLLMKIHGLSDAVEVTAMVGIDPESKGIARAKEMGVAVTHGGMEGFLDMRESRDVGIVLDATSAAAHRRHHDMLRGSGKKLIDLTPASIGPHVVPPVNLDEHLEESNVSMVSCGGQATVPVVAAVAEVAEVLYAEAISSIASDSAGPGTRANIDEFTRTTADALVEVGGAKRGKVIIILNPAKPPVIMRNTVFCLVGECDKKGVADAVERMVGNVRGYVPGYRLKQEIQFEPFDGETATGLLGEDSGLVRQKVTVFLEVEGAAHYLPSYAGNLDIMTAAALRTAELLAGRVGGGKAA